VIEMILTDEQMVLLTSLFSRGIQVAESALKEAIGGRGGVEQLMDTPELLPLPLLLERQTKFLKCQTLCGAYVDFSGPFSGRTMMVCDYQHGDPLVDKLFGRIFENDIPPDVYASMRPEALCELGNLLLNACISSFSELFGCEIRTGIPQHVDGDPREVLGIRKLEESEVLAFFMPLLISLGEQKITVSFIFEFFSIHSLVIALAARLEKEKYQRVAQDRLPEANLE